MVISGMGYRVILTGHFMRDKYERFVHTTAAEVDLGQGVPVLNTIPSWEPETRIRDL